MDKVPFYPEELTFLRAAAGEVAAQRPDCCLVELGTGAGHSTVALAAGLRDHLAAGRGRLVTIDDYREGEAYGWSAATARHRVVQAGLAPWVEFALADTHAATWRDWTEPLVLLFVDAGHDHASATADLALWVPRVRPGGLVVCHDVHAALTPGQPLPPRDDFAATGYLGTTRAFVELIGQLAPTQYGCCRTCGWLRMRAVAGVTAAGAPGEWLTAQPIVKTDCGRPDFWPALELFRQLGGQRIVEIGSIRAEGRRHAHGDGHSTIVWARNAVQVISVDIDPRATELTARLTREFGNVTAVNQDGIEFLQEFREAIDLLYLDGWDAHLPESARRHLEADLAARDSLHEHSLILIDDTEDVAASKGRLVIPHAAEDGWRVVFRRYQTLLARYLPPGTLEE